MRSDARAFAHCDSGIAYSHGEIVSNYDDFVEWYNTIILRFCTGEIAKCVFKMLSQCITIESNIALGEWAQSEKGARSPLLTAGSESKRRSELDINR